MSVILRPIVTESWIEAPELRWSLHVRIRHDTNALTWKNNISTYGFGRFVQIRVVDESGGRPEHLAGQRQNILRH